MHVVFKKKIFKNGYYKNSKNILVRIITTNYLKKILVVFEMMSVSYVKCITEY